MTELAVARVSLLRIVRDRRALFFLIVLPILVILIVGASVRGFGTFTIGVVDEGAGSSGHALVVALEHAPHLAVASYPTLRAADEAVAREEIAAAVVLPRGMDHTVRTGGRVRVPVIAESSNSTQQAAATAVSAVVSAQGGEVQAARFATDESGGTFEANLSRAASLAPKVAGVHVLSSVADSSSSTLPEGFAYSAPTMLVLFVFLNALAGGAVMIETRRLGLYERMASAPVRARSIVVGEALATSATTLLQSALIVVVAAVAFGVSWGNPLAATLLVIVWAFVGAGAGMLAGTLFRTPEQATAMGPTIGIAFGMLGGCMWPLAVVSSPMRAIGHLTPHAWAVDAWTTLLTNGGTVTSIGRNLLVLTGFAAAFLVLGSVRMRRILS